MLLSSAASASASALRAAAPLRAGVVVALIGLHAALLGYVVVRERDRLGPWLVPSLRGLAAGALGGAAMLASGAGYAKLLELGGVAIPDVAKELREAIPHPAILLAWGALLVPVAEETYFRGRLLDGVECRVGTGWALAASACAFALIHAIPVLTPAYLAFAVILWWLRRKTGGLFAPILAHALNNLIGLL